MSDDTINNEANSGAPRRSRRRTDCLSLPFRTHPLYHLRRAIILIAVLGILLCLVAKLAYPYSYYYPDAILHTAMFLCSSAFLCLLDLICWGTKKKDEPHGDPERPTGRWATMDLITAFVLQIVFWNSLSEIVYPYREANILGAYGILPALVSSVLHAWCFWKQLMDSKKKAWLLAMQRPACARCGFVESQGEASNSDEQEHVERPNVYPYAGPSATFARSNVVTPESPESAMEEGLLIGPDFGSYGSIEREEPVLDSPDDIVVGKGKKRAKSGGSLKSSTKASS